MRLEHRSEATLKQFIVDCVLNSGKQSKSDEREVTKEMLAKLKKDKFYIAPRKDNIIVSESFLDDVVQSQPSSKNPHQKVRKVVLVNSS